VCAESPRLLIVVHFGVRDKPIEQEIPSASLRASSSLRMKNAYAQDDTFVWKTKLTTTKS